MTCIVGLESRRGGVVIGGDSAGVSGGQLTIRADQKVWKSGEFAFGFTSSFRMGQLLRYSLRLPKRPPESAGQTQRDRWMTTEFIDAVRTTLKDGGWASVSDGNEAGGTFLVGWRGSLYRVESDFQVGRTRRGEDAVGSGQGFALGALAASRGIDLAAPRVRQALSIAAEYSTGVSGPFRVVTT